MNRRSLLLTVTTLALAALPVASSAQDVFFPAPDLQRPGSVELQSVKRLAGWLSAYLELELNERQLAELTEILDEQLPPISELSQQIADARRGFFAAVEPGGTNADEVRRFAVTQAFLYVEMVTRSANLKVDVFGVLNPEQQQRLGVMLGLVIADGRLGAHTVGP